MKTKATVTKFEMPQSDTVTRILASTADVRSFLLTEMVKVAEGKRGNAEAASICRLAQQIYNICKLELRAAEIAKRQGTISVSSVPFDDGRRK